MKATELMIGDWVKWTSDQCRTVEDSYPFKIRSICAETVQIDGRNNWYVESLIEPVTLTEDFMNRNFPEYEEGHEIGWWQHEDKETFHVEFVDRYRKIVMRGVKYVHELQHILRMCGLKKELIINAKNERIC